MSYVAVRVGSSDGGPGHRRCRKGGGSGGAAVEFGLCLRRVDLCGRKRDEFVFFFQAEDGIRDYKVTGVQTCALPIYLETRGQRAESRDSRLGQCAGMSPALS